LVITTSKLTKVENVHRRIFVDVGQRYSDNNDFFNCRYEDVSKQFFGDDNVKFFKYSLPSEGSTFW